MHPVDANKNVVIVLGMHRSGTSAIAAGLEQLGLSMGNSLYQGDEWNPKGYFEERQVVEFNNRLLASYNCRWDSPLPPLLGSGGQWEAHIGEAVELVRGLFGEAPAWGFKDPRMCLLAPFWGKVFSQLEVKPQLMLVVRHPGEVVHSLARRDGISVERGAWLWMTHLLGALEYLEIAGDMRFFIFDHLLFQPADFLSGVANWLGLTPAQDTIEHFAGDFIAPTLSHGSEAQHLSLPGLVLRAYEAVRGAIDEGMTPSALRESAQWIRITSEFQRDIIPKLLSVEKFYKDDRQLSTLESRIAALTKGLAVAEKMAVERLGEMRKLDTQLIQTSDALARAELIVLEQRSMLERANEQGGSESGNQVEPLAQSKFQQEATARLEALDSRLHKAETLAVERLEQMHKLDAQLNQTSAALARAEHIVLDQQAVIERQNEAYSLFREAELIAIERLEHMQKLDAQLIEMSAALSRAEGIVVEQQQAFQQRDEMQAGFREAERLAFERLAEMQKLNAQLVQTTDALANAERIVQEQQDALERAYLRVSLSEVTPVLVAESSQNATLDPQLNK
ncbi:hypothetical protein RJC98_16000 [Pseudomonas allii]|uniref:Uncharacterized protein n=1 Tax=Pseudomonas allii TaxID=2740531 RepID=A0ACC6LEE6_9PSED|nr:hypothetical protein [Pseudomonas allii]MDR9876693.1 hypothetical protein [Pseudomonas allii]